jgi:phosphoribosylglycinamide formyltransferase-1
MRSIVEARTGLEVKAVISNRPDAGGLEWARGQGLATQVVDHRQFPGREAFDAALAGKIEKEAPDYLILAGFMRIFTQGFVERFPDRIVNIHPSLLPAFTGLHTHRRAIAEGVKLHGATVHFVTPELDHGPIIVQGAVPVLPDDTEEGLAARVLAVEHRIYPLAVRWLVEGRVSLERDGRVRVKDAGRADDFLISPRGAA